MVARRTALAVSVAAVIAASIAVEACSSFSSADADPVAEAGLDGAPADAPIVTVEDALAPDGNDATPAIDADILATGFTDLTGIAASETKVYFLAHSDGVIHEVPLGGGTPAPFHKDPQATSPSSVVVTNNVLLWSDRGKKLLGQKNVGAGPADVQPVSGGFQPVALTTGRLSGGEHRLVVLTRDPAGSSGTVQYYDYLTLSLLTSTGASFSNLFDVAVFGDQVWWTEGSGGKIWEGRLETSNADARVSGEQGCESIAADSKGVYWTRQDDGLVRMMVPPAPTVTSLAMVETKPFSVAADESGVYWLTRDGKLRRSTREELPPQTISKGFDAAFVDDRVKAIALTSQFVVWITNDGKVLRHAK